MQSGSLPEPFQRYDVAIVGGGVIGLCIAEALAARGAGVVIIEAGRCGGGASAGNAGWITPSLSNPIPAPGTVAKGLRWTLSPRGPLRLRPVLRPSFASWLFEFWRSCSPRRHAAGIAATLALSGRALADFDALVQRLPVFEMHRHGVLFVSHDAHALAAEEATLRELQGHGYAGPIEVLDQEAALIAEPSLAPDVAGAILVPADRHVRPETLISALLVRLREQGVEVRQGEPVLTLGRCGEGWALTGDTGNRVRAGRVVLAGGAATSTLLASLRVRLPLQGAKGYSLTSPQATLPLRRPLYLLDSKVAVSLFDKALRLAGTLELGTSGLGISRSRVAGIEQAGRRTFAAWPGTTGWTRWAGMRPMVPDGLPVIGPVPGHPGLYLATGHAMLGVTLAPTTADLLAPVVLEGVRPPELAPFSVARFAERRRGGVRARAKVAP